MPTEQEQITELKEQIENLENKLSEFTGYKLEEERLAQMRGDIRGLSFMIYFREVDDGDSSTAQTISFTNGHYHKATLTDDVTFTFEDPRGACEVVIKLTQDDTGSRLVTWPANVLWAGGTAPTLSTGVGDIDIVSFYFDGVSYYGTTILDVS